MTNKNFKITNWQGCFHYVKPGKQVAICEDTGNWKKDSRLIQRFLDGIGESGWNGEVEW